MSLGALSVCGQQGLCCPVGNAETPRKHAHNCPQGQGPGPLGISASICESWTKKKMVVLRSGDTLGSPEQLLCSGPLRPNPHLFVLQDECTAGWKATRVNCPQSVPQVGGFLHLAWFPWSLTGEGVPGCKQQQA